MRTPVPHLYRLFAVALLLCGFHAAIAQSGTTAPAVDKRGKPELLLPAEPEAPLDAPAVVPEAVPDAITPAPDGRVAPATVRRAPIAPMDAAPQAPALVPGAVPNELELLDAPVAPDAPLAPAKPRTVDPVEPHVP